MKILRLCSFLALLLLSACATTPGMPGVEVSGLILQNNTSGVIEQVRLKVEDTGGVVSCGRILQGSECSTTFPARVYLGQTLSISWVKDEQHWIREALMVNAHEAHLWDEAASAQVSIRDIGEVDLQFIPRSRHAVVNRLR